MKKDVNWSFEEFQEMLAKRMGIPVERFKPKATFVDDLGIDSVRMTELILEFDRLGITIPPERIWDIQTVEDAYNFYLEQSGEG